MPEHLSSLLDSTEPMLLTTGWGRTEGPLWHAAGSVTFVDLAGRRLLRWDTSGQVRVVRERTGEGSGCTLDRQGRLLMCEGVDHRRITRMDTDGTVTTIAERWQGKRFNKPNDVVCRSDGGIFFTETIVCSVICPRPIPVCPMASKSIPPVGCCASAPTASGL